LFIIISCVIVLGLAAIWSTYQDIGGRNVATLLGIANMCGNLAAGVFATQIGIFAEANLWRNVFLYSCVSMLLVAVCWLFVNAGMPMLSEEKRK
jgi:nitrate/nitrite transporter NarK